MTYRIERKPQNDSSSVTKDGLMVHHTTSCGTSRKGDFFITTRAHQWMLKGMANDKLY